jgi:hypothetical protein
MIVPDPPGAAVEEVIGRGEATAAGAVAGPVTGFAAGGCSALSPYGVLIDCMICCRISGLARISSGS